MTLRSLLLLAALAVSPTLACAGKVPGAEVIEPALATARSDRAAGVAQLEVALASAEGVQADWLSIHAGELHRLMGNGRMAKRLFRDASRSADPKAARVAELGLAVFDGGEDPGSDELAVLTGVAEGLGPDTLEADRFLVLAILSSRTDDVDRTTQFVRKALKYAAADPQVETRIRSRLDVLAGGSGAGEAVAEAEGTDLERLDQAVESGNRSRVESLAARIAAEAGPDSDLAVIAKYATRRLDMPAPRNVVAVLLPMSGKYKGVGAQIKQAVELGRTSGKGGYRFVYIDTGADVNSAIAALEKAVFQEGAAAVIGPVRSEVAGPVAQVANALRVPLIGLHQDSTAGDDRPWVFDGLSTPEAQAQALVDFVMGERDMKAFAIFAPDTPYGTSAADAFTAAVEARGGTITVREHYDSEATDLIPFAKKLGRKDYKARAAEFREVKSRIQAAGGDPSRAVLPPIIDFDAIFVPDNRRRLPVAVAGLAYEEFPIGDFQVVKGERTYPLLGLSGWNHPELVTTGGPYVRSSVFVDPWFDESASAKAFANQYRADAGRAPSTLEAQAYSVGRLVSATANTTPDSRAAFRDALTTTTMNPTGTGATRIDPETRRIVHRMHVLTLTRSGIEEIKTASAPE